jgi:hypothetical protein
MDQVIIDNCIVSKFMGDGVSIRPINLEKKINPSFDMNSLRRITYGNRMMNNQILSQLSTGILKFEDLNFNNCNL